MSDDAPMRVSLDDGERVLWRGRLAVGAPWPSFARLGAGALAAWVALTSALFVLFAAIRALASQGPELGSLLAGIAGFTGVAVAGATAALAISKLVGPCYLSILWLLLTAPCLVSAWVRRVARLGWLGAVQHQDLLAFCLGAVFVGVPAAVLVLMVLDRLAATVVVTDRRLLELDGLGRIAAERAYTAGASDDLRVERPWRAPAGLLVAGPPREPLRLAVALRDDDPARVLEAVRMAREGRA